METGKNSQANIVKSYQRYLKLQRGFSPNTLDAYRRDLEKLLHYLKQEERMSGRCNCQTCSILRLPSTR